MCSILEADHCPKGGDNHAGLSHMPIPVAAVEVDRPIRAMGTCGSPEEEMMDG